MTALAERFARKVGEPDVNGCLPWNGFVDKAGYGRIRLGGRTEPVGYAHRVAWELFTGGPIPAGLTVDHVHARGCRRRDCVNPAHLEPVTQGENVARGACLPASTVRSDLCQRGHAFTANAYTHPKTGRRQCRECRKLRRSRAAR